MFGRDIYIFAKATERKNKLKEKRRRLEKEREKERGGEEKREEKGDRGKEQELCDPLPIRSNLRKSKRKEKYAYP